MQEEKASQLFQEFRLLSIVLQGLNEKQPGYQKRRRILLGELLDISKESRLLTEVKDVLDEIKIIQTSLQEQIDVVKSDEMRDLESSLSKVQVKYWRRPFEKAKDTIFRASRSFVTLKTRTEEVEKSVSRGVPQLTQKTKFGQDRTSARS